VWTCSKNRVCLWLLQCAKAWTWDGLKTEAVFVRVWERNLNPCEKHLISQWFLDFTDLYPAVVTPLDFQITSQQCQQCCSRKSNLWAPHFSFGKERAGCNLIYCIFGGWRRKANLEPKVICWVKCVWYFAGTHSLQEFSLPHLWGDIAVCFVMQLAWILFYFCQDLLS